MGQIRLAGSTLARLAVLTALAAGSAQFSDPAIAAKAKKAAAPAAQAASAENAAQAAATARQAYESGVKSFGAGRFQPAIDQFSTALRGGGLAGPEMAKALYLRGVSYKRVSKPGLAISDLTSALWLKNGLSDADRKSATAERAEAYRLAGLSDGAPPVDTPVATAPAVTAAAPAAPVAAPAKSAAAKAAPAPVAAAAAPEPQVLRQDPTSDLAQDAARARAQAAQQAEPGGLYSAASRTVTTGTSAAPVSPQAAVPVASAPVAIPAPIPEGAKTAAAPAMAALPGDSIDGVAQAPQPTGTVQSSIGSFFSNIFGGSAPAQVTTASTTASPPPPASSSWSSSVSGQQPKAAASAAKAQASAPPTVAAPAPVAQLKGKYKLHIAAVRSRAEAEALAQKLSAQHGSDLASHAPVVDEAVIGSMGTFYRVRVVGYATPDEPRGVCNKLRTTGFDCLVVTN